MDIPKSEKRTAARSTQLRKYLPLTKSEFLYSWHFVCVHQSLHGIESHNHFRALFQQIQVNHPMAFQKKGVYTNILNLLFDYFSPCFETTKNLKVLLANTQNINYLNQDQIK